jgi:hypothetical protein
MRGGDERGYRSGNIPTHDCVIVLTTESGMGPATRLTAAGHLDLDLDSARGPPRGEPRRENERMLPITRHFCISAGYNWPLLISLFLFPHFFPCLNIFSLVNATFARNWNYLFLVNHFYIIMLAYVSSNEISDLHFFGMQSKR